MVILSNHHIASFDSNKKITKKNDEKKINVFSSVGDYLSILKISSHNHHFTLVFFLSNRINKEKCLISIVILSTCKKTADKIVV